VPSIVHERPHWAAGRLVVGVDEVGRGALAGPLTLAAVALPTDRRLYQLRDSKRLRAEQREHLDARIRRHATGVGIGHVTAAEIDEIGLTAALHLGARRAVTALPHHPDVALIDGTMNLLEGVVEEVTTIVRGDDRCASIAAASIVAKVCRDAHMRTMDPRYPPYGFARHKGYAAPEHRQALLTHGPCAEHRHSWAPIAALAQPSLFDHG
jgi:ribonuclease HII